MGVKGDGLNLFGRDWLLYFWLDWTTIGIVTLDNDFSQVQLLKNKYKKVFTQGLGTMKKFKASLGVKSDAKPVFHRPRSVPYTIKDIIERELERLVREGIIEKLEHSEWTAPIVSVPKGDGQICACVQNKSIISETSLKFSPIKILLTCGLYLYPRYQLDTVFCHEELIS